MAIMTAPRPSKPAVVYRIPPASLIPTPKNSKRPRKDKRAPKPNTAQPARPQHRNFIENAYQDVLNALRVDMAKPSFMLVLAICATVIFTALGGVDKSVIASLLTSYKDTALAKWIIANQMSFIGAMTFVPVVYAAPDSYKVVVGVCAALWVLFVKETTVVEYVVQAAALHYYTRVNRVSTRITIAGLVVLAYWLGYLAMPAANVSSGTTASPRSGAHH
jgi:hypothetical protein